jgi:hypothetical protein
MIEGKENFKRNSLILEKHYSIALNDDKTYKGLIIEGGKENIIEKRLRSQSLIISLPKNFVPQLKPQKSNLCPSPIRLENNKFKNEEIKEKKIPKNTILHVFNIHNKEESESDSESYNNEELAFSECEEEENSISDNENDDVVLNDINNDDLIKMRKSFKVIRKRANSVFMKLNNDDYSIKSQVKDLQDYSGLIPKINLNDGKFNKNLFVDRNNKYRKEHRYMTMENTKHVNSILSFLENRINSITEN